MENSIKEALEKLTTCKKMKMYKLIRTFKEEGIENFVTTRKKYVDVILSDYKRILKKNEYMHNELDKQQTTINKYAKENGKLQEKLLDVLERKLYIKKKSKRQFNKVSRRVRIIIRTSKWKRK